MATCAFSDMDGPATGQWVAPWTFPEIFANFFWLIFWESALCQCHPGPGVALIGCDPGVVFFGPGVSGSLVCRIDSSAGALERVQVVVF